MANFKAFMFVFVIASAHLINHSASSEKSNLAYGAGFIWKLARNFVPTPSPCDTGAPVVAGEFDYPDHEEVSTDAPTDAPTDASTKATKEEAAAENPADAPEAETAADTPADVPAAEAETPTEAPQDASPTEAPTEAPTDEQPAE